MNCKTSALALCTRIPLAKATTPKEGFVCHTERWWVVTPEREILLYRRHSLQCNPQRHLAERIRDDLYPGCTVEYLPVVYLPPERE